ncbi:cupin domain-containing protein [Candidatus Bipolaricaulota bacterium]|nr:cupin domain-containing protein [Candidatus Bipolaricaulota bacterium]
MKGFFRTQELPLVEMLPGIRRRAVWTDGAMLTFFSFDHGSVVPEHEHPHEQITVVTCGELEFTLDGETRVLRAGEGVRIGSNLRHSARALAGATEAFDAWNPPREDYKTVR